MVDICPSSNVHSSPSSGTPQTRRLQTLLYTCLDERERAHFLDILSAYGFSYDVFELVKSLYRIFNTPTKRKMLSPVRDIIRKSDVKAFDLMTRSNMNYATLSKPVLYSPLAADFDNCDKDQSMTLSRPRNMSRRKLNNFLEDFYDRTIFLGTANMVKSNNVDNDVILMHIKSRKHDAGFGFSIRGGPEYLLGVLVSNVVDGGPAERQGLRKGDYIMEVNDISLRGVTYQEATKVNFI